MCVHAHVTCGPVECRVYLRETEMNTNNDFPFSLMVVRSATMNFNDELKITMERISSMMRMGEYMSMSA